MTHAGVHLALLVVAAASMAGASLYASGVWDLAVIGPDAAPSFDSPTRAAVTSKATLFADRR